MQSAASGKDKLFRKFKGGNAAALADLLEGERMELYDYLMRMTGQVSRSAETIDEVYQSLDTETLTALGSYHELRLCLYTTARKFSTDIWNADTTKLMNSAIEVKLTSADSQVPSELAADGDSAEQQVAWLLDRLVRSLPGREREALLLGAQRGFVPSEVGEIMGLPEHEMETLGAAVLARLTRDSQLGAHTTEHLRRLPGHPLPVRSTQATVNLSMVMQGIKTRPVGLWSPLRVAMVAAVLVLVALWFLYPGFYTQIFGFPPRGTPHPATHQTYTTMPGLGG